jgi:hypothetical protein
VLNGTSARNGERPQPARNPGSGTSESLRR